MNQNRNRYASAPLYGIKNKKTAPKPQEPQSAPQAPQAPQQPQVNAYPQQGYNQGYPPQQQGYNQSYNQGYQPQTNAYPQQGYAPYGQQGYYQQPQGYNPNGQPQYAPQNQAYGMNGQPVQQQLPVTEQAYPHPAATPNQPKDPRRFNWLLGVMALLLPVVFILALIINSMALRIAFLGCAGVAIILMWAFKAFAQNARYTLTLIYAALMVVVGVALFLAMPGPESKPAGSQYDPQALFGGDRALDSQSATNVQQNTQANVPGSDDFTVNNLPEEVTPTSPAEIQLNAFMSYWAESQLDSMVGLCLPSWANNLENPKSELFILLANRTPLSYVVEEVSGSDADTSRTVTLTVLIDKKSTSEPAYYQMQVLMLRINEHWYVDPNSLGGTKLASTPVPGSTAEAEIPFVPTATPTPTEVPSAITMLYYNADGGVYYHADQRCSSVDEKYLPLTAFYFSDLNNTTFKNLLPCTKCDAPTRPLITGN